MRVSFKMLNNFRQIIHVKNIDLCKFFINAKSYFFLNVQFFKMKAAFPNIVFKCPFRVNIILWFIKTINDLILFFKEIQIHNLSITAGLTDVKYPDGNYKIEYWVRNNDMIIQLSTFHVLLSKERIEM